MQVKIIKNSESVFWYKDYIGQTFEVIGNPKYPDDLYQVINWINPKKIGNQNNHYIMKCDCIPLNEQRYKKLKRIIK